MFKLTVALPDRIAFEGNVEILNVVTTQGQIGILTGHVPFVDMIKTGEIHFTAEDGEVYRMAVSGGWLFVWSRDVTVFVNASEFDYEIDLDQATAEKERAEKKILELAAGDHDVIQSAHAKASLEKAINRITIGHKKIK